jgi:gamma-glutamyltranspeptidase/glutathione hydrolase
MDGYDNKTVDSGGAVDAGVMALVAELVECSGRSAVTAASQAAIGAGIAMLARGGNAYDAALATAFMENVALPMKCGLGGDLVALVINDGQPEALVSIGPGIAALSDGKPLELTGPTAIGIPGAPGGYTALAERARFPLSELVKPAIEAAGKGVQWSRIAVALTQESQALLRKYNGENCFLPGGRLPREGETLRLPGLAQLLGRFAERGAGLFQGSEGERLASRIRQAGGFMTADDLSVNPAQWKPAISLRVGRDTVWATPHPTHGEGLLISLQAALERRMAPVAAARFAREELRRRSREPADSGTSVVTAADDAGRHVVIVHSNSFPTYGSGVLVEEWDLVLNNRPGRGFTTNVPTSAANAPKRGRVPLTTLNAWAVRRGDSLYTGATPGGVNQAIWNLQTVLECLDGKTPGAIVTAPRFSLDAADKATWEGNHSAAHSGDGKVAAVLSNRSATQVTLRNLTTGVVTAAADPRMSARAVALS